MFVDKYTDRDSHDDFDNNNKNGGLLGGCMVGRLLILYFKLRDAAGATASCPCLRMWLTMQSTSLVIPSLHLYQLLVLLVYTRPSKKCKSLIWILIFVSPVLICYRKRRLWQLWQIFNYSGNFSSYRQCVITNALHSQYSSVTLL